MSLTSENFFERPDPLFGNDRTGAIGATRRAERLAVGWTLGQVVRAESGKDPGFEPELPNVQTPNHSYISRNDFNDVSRNTTSAPQVVKSEASTGVPLRGDSEGADMFSLYADALTQATEAASPHADVVQFTGAAVVAEEVLPPQDNRLVG